MSALIQPSFIPSKTVIYPESDGKPMAENTLQYQWIVTIKEGLDVLLPDAFVAADLFWYPVEGNPKIVQAPDVLVALGRPKGHRGSYRQWEEGNLAPQVVFEILSPGNRHLEMVRKERFYERYGVEEYYVYDPETNELAGWVKKGAKLEAIEDIRGWISPPLGIRFEPTPETLEIYRPDGRKFLTYAELDQQAKQAELLAEQERQRAEQERQRAEQAEARTEQERQAKEEAQAQMERLKQKLQELGVNPDQIE